MKLRNKGNGLVSKRSIQSFCQALKKHNHFLLSCHVDPEGDAIGSLLAMDSLLRRLGKQSTIVCQDPVPKRLEVLLSKRWRTVDQMRQSPFSFKALLTTDCPTLERLGKVQDLLTPDTVIFNIDHHVSNEYFGHFNYVVPKAAACGEVVYDLFKRFKLPVSRDEAKNLYISIMTDTGSFKYASTTGKCHQVAAELMETGLDVETINEIIYSTYSLNKIKLYSRLLARIKTSADGKIAWVAIRRSDLTHADVKDEDIEGFIDFLKYIKEVKIAFLIIELREKNKIRASFRSKEGYDVNKVATYFHGGGHTKAAGCVIRSSLAQAEKKILTVVRKRLST